MYEVLSISQADYYSDRVINIKVPMSNGDWVIILLSGQNLSDLLLRLEPVTPWSWGEHFTTVLPNAHDLQNIQDRKKLVRTVMKRTRNLTDLARIFEPGRLPALPSYIQPATEPTVVVEVVLLRVRSERCCVASWRVYPIIRTRSTS